MDFWCLVRMFFCFFLLVVELVLRLFLLLVFNVGGGRSVMIVLWKFILFGVVLGWLNVDLGVVKRVDEDVRLLFLERREGVV